MRAPTLHPVSIGCAVESLLLLPDLLHPLEENAHSEVPSAASLVGTHKGGSARPGASGAGWELEGREVCFGGFRVRVAGHTLERQRQGVHTPPASGAGGAELGLSHGMMTWEMIAARGSGSAALSCTAVSPTYLDSTKKEWTSANWGNGEPWFLLV